MQSALAILERIGNTNAKGEYYLTDAVAIARDMGLKAVAIETGEDDVRGINTKAQLAQAEAVLQARLRSAALDVGVTMIAPETVFLSADTRFGKDVTIEPNVVFGPGVTVEDGATIRSFSHLEGARVGKNARVGPFARLRPGTDLGKGVHIGNFVEVKAATIEAGAKANHLSYIGDARVGAAANIGAGTITCNYDGVTKHHTDIGAGAFIGSNSSLVAPVKIGDNAYVGSGSVVTKDVPADGIWRSRARRRRLRKGLGKTLAAVEGFGQSPGWQREIGRQEQSAEIEKAEKTRLKCAPTGLPSRTTKCVFDFHLLAATGLKQRNKIGAIHSDVRARWNTRGRPGRGPLGRCAQASRISRL